MDEPAGVLFDVDAGDASTPRLAPGDELEVSVDRQWEVELRNLVSLGQVRVEVVLAIEFAEGRDRAVERDPGQDRGLDGRRVQYGQRARKPSADDANECVRGRVRVPG